MCDGCLRPAPFVRPPHHKRARTHRHTNTRTLPRCFCLACLVIWQRERLYNQAAVSRTKKKKSRGKRHIITCFLSTAEPDPDRTCEKKKSIRRCCLGYALPLVFSTSKNNTEEPEVGGSPPIGVSQPLECGVEKASSGRGGEKMNGRVLEKKLNNEGKKKKVNAPR